jgi:hypothetical protein
MTASQSLGAAPAALLTLLLLFACRPGTAERPAGDGASEMSAATTPPSQDAKAAKSEALATENREIVLDAERVTVTIETPVTLPESVDQGRLGLNLEGVEFGRPGIYFEVYAGLPPGAEPAPKGPYYLGTLSSFGPKEGPGTQMGFDITKLVRTLEAQKRWTGKLDLTFVRRGLEPPPGQPQIETVLEDVPPVRVKRVRIVRE